MKLRYSFALTIAIVLFVSCSENYKEYNTNAHEVTDEMLDYDNLRIGGFIPQIEKDIIPSSDETANDYQRAQNLAGDVYSGYMGAVKGFNNSSNGTTYDFSLRWQNEAFKVAYMKVMPAWKKVADLSKETNPSNYAFVQVLKIAAMHRITDMYGPIPYSAFGSGALTTPYDSQADVYHSFFIELNEAIDILKDFVNKYPDSKPLKKFDLIFGGDMSKCLKFANALKLRLAMRISYVEPALAKKYAEEAVKEYIIDSNSDNVTVASANGVSVFNPVEVLWNMYKDIRMGANMESFLLGYNDPRCLKYFQKSTYDAQEYRGIRNGLSINDDARASYEKVSAPNIFPNTPIRLMCAAEVAFLRAEGALRGWNMGGTAKEFYEEGIKLSFAQWGVSLGSYLNDNTSKPAPFQDKIISSASVNDGNNKLSTITIKWDDKADFEVKLERLITQKWLAMYPDGQEAWTEFRRTGYPKIFPVINNCSGGKVDTDIQIRRLPYPTTEYDTSRAEVEKAISLLGGNDIGGTKLWWDKK